MKALVGAFNQEKALVGAFSVIVQPVVEPMDRFAALVLGDGGHLPSHPLPVLDVVLAQQHAQGGGAGEPSRAVGGSEDMALRDQAPSTPELNMEKLY